MIDPRFRVEVIAATPNPQTLIWRALHTDYSERFIVDEEPPSESKAGEIAVKRLLEGGRGHFGCLEHPQISFACGYFPHSVMVQLRTHRTGISMDVQSMRYSGKRIHEAVAGGIDIEDVFYLRPVGEYTDRQGKRYKYISTDRDHDLALCWQSAERYKQLILWGHPEEHARGILCADYRQHFVVSLNLRSAFHVFDLRAKADAQLEIRQLCELMWPHVERWVPEIAAWYKANRYGKARLSP